MRLRGPAHRRALALSPEDAQRLDRILREIADDPWTDGRWKFDYSRPPLVARIYRDARLSIVYQLVRYDPDEPWIVDVMAISGPAVTDVR